MKKTAALLTAIFMLCTTVLGAHAAGLATPATGDNSMSIIIPIIVLVVAAIGIAVLVLIKKKKG